MNICDSVLIRAAPALSQSLHIQTIYQLLPASCGVPRHQLQTDLSFSPLSFSLRMGSDVACPTVSTSPPVHPHICRDMCSTPQWSRTNDNYDIHPLWRLEIVQLSCPLFIIFPKSVFFFFTDSIFCGPAMPSSTLSWPSGVTLLWPQAAIFHSQEWYFHKVLSQLFDDSALNLHGSFHICSTHNIHSYPYEFIKMLLSLHWYLKLILTLKKQLEQTSKVFKAFVVNIHIYFYFLCTTFMSWLPQFVSTWQSL